MITINMITTALSPITHMSGTSGNTALLKRETLIGSDGNIERIPCISGNALRHALIRIPAAGYLFKILNFEKVPYQMADFFWHGGKLTKASPLSGQKTKEFVDALPFVGLLGGAMPGQILEGALRVSRALLICKESQKNISLLSGVDVKCETGCENFVSSYLYTRASLPNDPDDICDRMIYEGETVIAGSKFYHNFIIDSDNTRLLGCLLHAMRNSNHSVGGMGRIGHGELSIQWASEGVTMEQENDLISDYESFTKESAPVVKDALNDIFSGYREERAEKASPKKQTKTKIKDSSELDFFGALDGGENL